MSSLPFELNPPLVPGSQEEKEMREAMEKYLDEIKNQAGQYLSLPVGMDKIPIEQAKVRILYTNWQGKTSWRHIVPMSLEFKATEWHPEEQWLLKSWDLDKQDYRSFAIADIKVWSRPGSIPLPESERRPLPPKVVVLCGSTKFKEAFIQANFQETMKGNIVLSVGWFSHSDSNVYFPTEEEKIRLDELHKRKIDLSDEVLVLNVPVVVCGKCGKPCESTFHPTGATGYSNSTCCRANACASPYIGESTKSEIEYATKLGKPIRYLVAPQ